MLRNTRGRWLGSEVAYVRGPYSYSVLAIIWIAAISGFLTRARRGFTILEAFLAAYLVVILLWPIAAGIRIAFPFMPWIGFLVLSGAQQHRLR